MVISMFRSPVGQRVQNMLLCLGCLVSASVDPLPVAEALRRLWTEASMEEGHDEGGVVFLVGVRPMIGEREWPLVTFGKNEPWEVVSEDEEPEEGKSGDEEKEEDEEGDKEEEEEGGEASVERRDRCRGAEEGKRH